MHHLASAATLQRLLEQSPLGSTERIGYEAEQLGQESAMNGWGCRTDLITEDMIHRYQQGYDEATIKAKLGEVTLSPAEVWRLKEAL